MKNPNMLTVTCVRRYPFVVDDVGQLMRLGDRIQKQKVATKKKEKKQRENNQS